MTTPLTVLPRPKGRPGPKPRGRTVVPLTITVTHAQRAGLAVRADAEKSSISTVVRRFIAAGLTAGNLVGLFVLIALLAIMADARCGLAVVLPRAATCPAAKAMRPHPFS